MFCTVPIKKWCYYENILKLHAKFYIAWFNFLNISTRSSLLKTKTNLSDSIIQIFFRKISYTKFRFNLKVWTRMFFNRLQVPQWNFKNLFKKIFVIYKINRIVKVETVDCDPFRNKTVEEHESNLFLFFFFLFKRRRHKN